MRGIEDCLLRYSAFLSIYLDEVSFKKQQAISFAVFFSDSVMRLEMYCL
jgi:hypothetical protein